MSHEIPPSIYKPADVIQETAQLLTSQIDTAPHLKTIYKDYANGVAEMFGGEVINLSLEFQNMDPQYLGPATFSGFEDTGKRWEAVFQTKSTPNFEWPTDGIAMNFGVDCIVVKPIE